MRESIVVWGLELAVAGVEDVNVSLMRSLDAREAEYVDALLSRVETMIRVRVPDVKERAARDGSFAALVAQVEAEAVARVFRAGEAGGIYSSESEDGYSYSLNFRVASGLLDVLAEEWTRLLGGGGYRTVGPRVDGYSRRYRVPYPEAFKRDLV